MSAKKISVLSIAVLLGVSSIAVGQAQEADTTMQDSVTTEPATNETSENEASGTINEEADATVESDADVVADDTPEPEPEIPQDPPHVQKLISLYPQLVARIAPFGQVCFAGEPCTVEVTVAGGAADGEPRDGSAVYNAVCSTCHTNGLLGSPITGDAGSWASHLAKGAPTLYDNAINGINNMPARGGADIPDEEVINAVDYMIAQVS